MPWTAELTRRLPAISVAAGVLSDDSGRVLIAKRPEGSPLSGWWEFPGGKIAAGESAQEALVRELAEELGIRVTSASEFLTFTHEYPDRSVRLHVFKVTGYSGDAVGAEGQPVRWESVDALMDAGLLPADLPIVTALQALAE